MHSWALEDGVSVSMVFFFRRVGLGFWKSEHALI